MMDYKEMAAIVKERGDAILKKRAERSRRIKQFVFSASGIAVSAAAAFLIWQNNDISHITERNSVNNNIISDVTTSGNSPEAYTTTVPAICTDSTNVKSTTTESETKKSVTNKTVSTAAEKTGIAQTTISVQNNNNSSRNTVTVSSSSANPRTSVRTSAAASSAETTVTTTVITPENKEEIRMKVEHIKKYLAALSAAALSVTPLQSTSAADDIYTPKPMSANLEYYLNIQNNTDKLDFNGNGEFDVFDSYALYTFINGDDSLPDGYVERIIKNGDINKDYVMSKADYTLLFDYCMYSFFDEQLAVYREGEAAKKILCDKITDESQYYELYACNKRYLSPDCTPEEREKYLCWFVHESYTYGSEDNLSNYLTQLYSMTFADSSQYRDRIDDLGYYNFIKETEEKNLSFDINEDGEINMKDAYDVYIYNCCLPYFDPKRTAFYYDIENKNNGNLPIAQLIDLSDVDKELLTKNCEPLFDAAAKYIIRSDESMENIIRYIMSESEVSYSTLLTPYYSEYRQLTIFDEPVEYAFIQEIKPLLSKYFDSYIDQFAENKPDKIKESEIIDAKYFDDNEAFKKLLNDSLEDFQNGKTTKLYDVNKDGKVDRYDGYIAEIYGNELYKGVTAEYTTLPEEIWNYLDKEFDPNGDGFKGSIIDIEVLSYVANNNDKKSLTQYEKDIYFIELLEQKEFKNKNDIEPFMSEFCSGKKTGDVNFDGMITAVDASEVLTYYSQMSVDSEISSVTEMKMEYLADFNDDAIIDSRDASLILTEYARNSVN